MKEITIMQMWFLVLTCLWFQSFADSEETNSLIIEQVVSTSNADAVSTFPEPSVCIIGYGNQCVDVSNENYTDGNQSILWRCSSGSPTNQHWTIHRDGTIQSKGKCLSVKHGYNPGSSVLIYNCSLLERDATRWQIFNNRTIIHRRSGLALAVRNGTEGSELLLRGNTYATGQSWMLTNDTRSIIRSIRGLDNLCLERYGAGVLLQQCQNKVDQKWALYEDSSIRPQADQKFCLSTNGRQESVLQLLTCSALESGQRWMYMKDGSINSLLYRLVLDVERSNHGNSEIVVNPFKGLPGQKWSVVV